MKGFHLVISCMFFFLQHAISQVLPGGSPAIGITVAGGNGAGSLINQLNQPGKIFVDASGSIYIADLLNNRIQKWAPGVTYGITVAGGNGFGFANNQLAFPTSVFVDAGANMYIPSSAGHRILKWPPGATQGTVVAGSASGGAAANQLQAPSDVFVDREGNMYIADFSNARIQKWAPGATTGITVAGGNGFGRAANQLEGPTGLFVDLSGNIYIADGSNQRIQKWVPGAAAGITVAGGNGSGPAPNQLSDPSDVSVDSEGNIYIADRSNHRIQKWAPGATTGITVAGGNGSGSAANQLSAPIGIFVDTLGHIYVSDEGNDRVQEFGATNINLTGCPPNLVFVTPGCSDRATITWTAPRDSFPALIRPSLEIDPQLGTMIFMGALNGHGYYRSVNTYLWPVAADIAKYVGDTLVNGHLVTITSAEENTFINNRISGSGYSPWIGLSSTGVPGKFQWVNGEPLSYTKWASGEPSNRGGSANNLREPYVRISDAYEGTWNDQRSDYLPFIAEFESPLIRYRQISGPANGSAQPAGVYNVCYEVTNLISGTRENCCFSITVTCNAPSITSASGSVVADKTPSNDINQGLRIATSSNPGNKAFKLSIASNTREPVSVVVTDESGRIMESIKGIAPGQTLDVGMHYRPGIYLARFIQGKGNVVVKLIKHSN